jgi:hypothetical protein
MRYCNTIISSGVLAIGLLGCTSTPQHSNTLIFSTTTKVAIDVSAEPTTGSPDITIGYKRVEGVWMPLLANKTVAEDKVTPADCDGDECVFQGIETNKDGVIKTDSYSVLASLGATFGGDAKTGTAAASGGISQFFATGIAAQKLAESGGSRLVTVQPTSTQEVELQTKRADKAEEKVSELENQLKTQMGTEKYTATVNAAKNKNTKSMAQIALILATVAPGNILKPNVWKGILDKSTLTSKAEIKEKGILTNCAEVACIDKRLTSYLIKTDEHRNIISKISKTTSIDS